MPLLCLRQTNRHAFVVVSDCLLPQPLASPLSPGQEAERHQLPTQLPRTHIHGCEPGGGRAAGGWDLRLEHLGGLTQQHPQHNKTAGTTNLICTLITLRSRLQSFTRLPMLVKYSENRSCRESSPLRPKEALLREGGCLGGNGDDSQQERVSLYIRSVGRSLELQSLERSVDIKLVFTPSWPWSHCNSNC